METETALMAIILPVTYVLVDLIRPIPHVPDWMLPIIAACIGSVLGICWAWGQGEVSTESLMVHGVVGFSFGAGATGANQIKAQAQSRQEDV